MILDYDDVLFIHIPKTGGTSINFMLRDKGLNKWKIENRQFKFEHESYMNLLKLNNIHDRIYKFSIVRNPFTRAYSYYHHFNLRNQLNFSFFNFLKFIKNKKNTNLTPWISYTQSFFLYDTDRKIRLNKIYYFENLLELENDFKIRLPYLNKGSYNKDQYYIDYNEENIDLVRDIYKEDFTNFDYSQNFK